MSNQDDEEFQQERNRQIFLRLVRRLPAAKRKEAIAYIQYCVLKEELEGEHPLGALITIDPHLAFRIVTGKVTLKE